MREDFLHYLWKYQLFTTQINHTRAGHPIEVIHPGVHNHDSGPDFFNARIKIGDTVWAGNVEIHVNASDWVQHGHSTDPAYDNVILHVVYNDDEPVKLSDSVTARYT